MHPAGCMQLERVFIMKKYTATLVVTYRQNVEVEVANDCTPKQLLAQIVDKFDQFGSQVTTTIEDVEETA
jgi:hypothetical protein